MIMVTEVETVEQRLKSFLGQLRTESGILERIVYKHKNQHRRCSYFQYVLEVRRDMNLLKSLNLEEILDASFLVINGDRPKQKLQLLESLKRSRCDGGKYNFLERLLGAARLLSLMVEPLLKAAMEHSIKLNQEGFEAFREYYPRKMESTVTLDCVWQVDKYVLVEGTEESKSKSKEKDEEECCICIC